MARRTQREVRQASSLMEVMATVALSAVLMTPVVNLLMTSHSIWEGVDGDATRRWSADATARHIAHQLIDAKEVVAISDLDAAAGSLSIRTHSGDTFEWRHEGESVFFSDQDTKDQLLSREIKKLQFIGYARGGLIQTHHPLLIESVECVVHTQLTSKRDYVARRLVRLRQLPQGVSIP